MGSYWSSDDLKAERLRLQLKLISLGNFLEPVGGTKAPGILKVVIF